MLVIFFLKKINAFLFTVRYFLMKTRENTDSGGSTYSLLPRGLRARAAGSPAWGALPSRPCLAPPTPRLAPAARTRSGPRAAHL